MKKIAAATVAALALSGLVACGVPTSQSSAAAPVTPAACLSALGHADELQALSAEAFDVVGEALTYASQLNAAGINAQTSDLPIMWRMLGRKYEDLIGIILDEAMTRVKR